jgi:hypothetical protein
MSVYGPKHHLARRSGSVAFRGEAEVRTHVRNDAIDPKRHFASVNCSIAKGLFNHFLGDGEHGLRNDETKRITL